MNLNNQVHGEILIQDTSTNPKSRGVRLPSQVGERCRGVGGGGEAVGDDSGSGPPSNIPLVAAYSLYISLFSISASVHHEIKSMGYIGVFRSKSRRWHGD
jgi:hypothetical protein